MANFIAECSTPPHGDEQQADPYATWMLYAYGSTTNEGTKVGLILVSPKGHMYNHALKLLFKALNNKDEYEALLDSMDLCYTLRAEHLRAFSVSLLMVSQVRGDYQARDVPMVAYL